MKNKKIQSPKPTIQKNHRTYNRDKSLQDCLMSNTPNGGRSPRPAQKPKIPHPRARSLLPHYQSLLTKMMNHAKAIKNQIVEQISKHDLYYDSMIKIIKQKQLESKNFLMSKLSQIKDKFQNKIQKIKTKISQLSCQFTPLPIERQKQQLQSHKSLKIEIIKIECPQQKIVIDYLAKLTLEIQYQQQNMELNNSTIQYPQELACKQQLTWKLIRSCDHKCFMDVKDVISELPQLVQDSTVSN